MLNPPHVSRNPSINSWTNLSDGSPVTFAHTGESPDAFMQLDMGATGRPFDRVRLVNRKDPLGGWAYGNVDRETMVAERLNGVTLKALDIDNTVIFSYTFSGITRNSPTVYDFDRNGNII
jgi:hypothetical protein